MHGEYKVIMYAHDNVHTYIHVSYARFQVTSMDICKFILGIAICEEYGTRQGGMDLQLPSFE